MTIKTCYRNPSILECAYLKWDCGDGATTIGFRTPVTHVYGKSGIYITTMILTDTEGATAIATQKIEVLAAP
jgi:PKD repeat protein